jgi:flavodoxin
LDVDIAHLVNNRVLVAYYSRTGHTKALALEVCRLMRAEEVDVDCVELEPLRELSIFHLGRRSLTNTAAPIKSLEVSLDGVNLLVLGTPVWLTGPAPFVRSFIQGAGDLKGLSTIIFATCSGSDRGAEDDMRELVREGGGRPYEYHLWRINRDGPDGLAIAAEAVAASARKMLPGPETPIEVEPTT